MPARIYLAEDTPEDLLITRAILEGAGPWEFHEFSDGLSLFQRVQEDPPDLLVLDIILPRLTGLAVTRLLKFHERTRHLPVVIVSSITDADIRARVEGVGADAFVPKPLNGPTLADEVTRLLAATGRGAAPA